MSNLKADLDSFNGLITFYLNDELFCVSIDDVFAILNPADYSNNFKNSYLINSHLEIGSLTISVIDLHSLFGMKKNKITPLSRFICMDIKGQAFGFLADKVEEMITLNDEIKKNLILTSKNAESLLLGEVKYQNTVFNLPNFQKIIKESFVHH